MMQDGRPQDDAAQQELDGVPEEMLDSGEDTLGQAEERLEDVLSLLREDLERAAGHPLCAR
jgi:hypothetical protein